MKKMFIFIFFLLLFPIKIYAEEDLAPNAKSAIMIEASTGEILFEKNSNERLAPASMTKMMSLLLIFEEIDKGKIKWDEIITASEHASSMGGSQIFLKVGEKMSVLDLIKGITIASGNDVTVTKKQSYVISVKMPILMTKEPIDVYTNFLNSINYEKGDFDSRSTKYCKFKSIVEMLNQEFYVNKFDLFLYIVERINSLDKGALCGQVASFASDEMVKYYSDDEIKEIINLIISSVHPDCIKKMFTNDNVPYMDDDKKRRLFEIASNDSSDTMDRLTNEENNNGRNEEIQQVIFGGVDEKLTGKIRKRFLQ